MASNTQILFTTLCVLLQLCVYSHSFPALSEISTDIDAAQTSYILSALNSRTKREALTKPEVPSTPEVAAHYGRPVPRSYNYIAPSQPLVRSYYYYPRVYVRVPAGGYYPSPKSELFRMSDLAGGYINNLLPIFNKETPLARVDPVPAVLPAIPKTSSDGRGVDNVLDSFPFWNQQASNWVWPDGISTGSLPQAEVQQVGPQSTLFQLQSKNQVAAELQNPLPTDIVDLPPLQGDSNNAPVEPIPVV